MNPSDLAALESSGVEGVLRDMALGGHGEVGSRRRGEVEAWLRSKQLESDSAAANKRDAREEETLSIAKRALSIAEEANRIASDDLEAARTSAASAERQAKWARWAAIIAMIAAITAAATPINELIAFLQT